MKQTSQIVSAMAIERAIIYIYIYIYIYIKGIKQLPGSMEKLSYQACLHKWKKLSFDELLFPFTMLFFVLGNFVKFFVLLFFSGRWR